MTEGGLLPGSLGVALSKPVSIPHEDGSPGTESGFHVSMTGVPYEISSGLNASTQLRANQANDVLALALTQMSRVGQLKIPKLKASPSKIDDWKMTTRWAPKWSYNSYK